VATADPDNGCIGDCDGGALDVIIRFSLGSFNLIRARCSLHWSSSLGNRYFLFYVCRFVIRKVLVGVNMTKPEGSDV
jgi:hypothetical protein